MADMNPFHPDYGAPGEAAPPPAAEMPQAAAPGQGGDLTSRWAEFLGDPASRAALISFGAQLAQPMAIGQNWMGHVGQAIGKGGEGATKAAAIERADADSLSKQDLRSSQIDASIAKSQTAEANANTAATRAQAYQTGVESRSELNRAKAETEVYRQGQLEAQKNFLEEKIRMYPDSEFYKQQLQAVQIDLTRGRTSYLAAREEAIPQDVATRQQRANTQQQDADTRQQRARDQTVLGTQAEERKTAQGGSRTEQQYVAEYEKYKNNTTKANNDPLSRGEKQPILPYQEWRKGYPSGKQGAAGAPPAGGDAPLAPPVDQRKPDTIYRNANEIGRAHV